MVLEKKDGRYIDTVLFDRKIDPYEMENMATAHPAMVSKLVEEQLGPWLKKIGDPFLQK